MVNLEKNFYILSWFYVQRLIRRHGRIHILIQSISSYIEIVELNFRCSITFMVLQEKNVLLFDVKD